VEVCRREESGGKTQGAIMPKVTMKALLESGVHFGHRTHRWNPYMKPYIFTERNGIHIIDLQQTVKSLEDGIELVRDTVAEGGTVLFVGTKRQAHETIQLEAERCGMPFVTVRWLGGMLTNWITMRQRVLELERLERERDQGEFERLTKKEALQLNRKIAKLEARFGGIRKLHRLPELLFIVDVRREETAVKEANSLGIPVLALVDTNCDPRNIDHVIPSNDDAIRAIKLMVGLIADGVLEGRAMRKEEDIEELPAAHMEAEEELSDADLLGEATLAKVEAAQAVAAAKVDAEAEVEELEDEEKVEKKARVKAKVEEDIEEEEEGDIEPEVEKAPKAKEKTEKKKPKVEEPPVKAKQKAEEEKPPKEVKVKAEEEKPPKEVKVKAEEEKPPKEVKVKAEEEKPAKEVKEKTEEEKPKAKTKPKTKTKSTTKAAADKKEKPKTKAKAKTKTKSKTEKK
jgi:small subunit ribosomal protein S2